MKTELLNIIAAAGIAALTPAYAEDKKDEAPTSSSASSTVITNGDGTATVTIEVNGKKETKTFKLGDGKPFTFKLEDKDGLAFGGGGSGKIDVAKKAKVTWLGIATEPVADDVRAQLPLKEGEGLSVTHVAPESPAAKAGIEEHDIITRFDNQILVGAEQLKSLVKMHKAGDKVKIASLRKGQPHDTEAALEEHEVEVGRDDILGKWLDNPGIRHFQGRNFLKDDGTDNEIRGGALRNKLKELKEKFQDNVVDRKAFILGADGKAKKLDGDLKLNDIVELTRKHLEEAKLPAEVRDQLLKSIEDMVKSGGNLLKDSDSAVNDLKKEIEQVRKELEKTKDELQRAKESSKP